jgi:hypothetical protein
MEEATIKLELHEKIEQADIEQLREINGLLTNYFNSKYDPTEGWDSIPDHHKEHILEGLAQAEAGLGIPAKEVIARTRKKYGLNG